MQCDADQVIQQVSQKKFPSRTYAATKTTLLRKFKVAMRPLVDFIDQRIQAVQLGQANLKLGTATTISLELNVINMPYSSPRPLKRLVNGDGVKPVNVYVMMKSPYLNRSEFRIDGVDSATRFHHDPLAELPKLHRWVQKQFQQVKKYRAVQAKVPRATRRAQHARHSRRRGTRRRSTTPRARARQTRTRRTRRRQ